ncbi:MAG: hypothetical protein ABI587_02700 [Gemmatimonadales bacterium]
MLSQRAVRAFLASLVFLAWSQPAAAQESEPKVRWTIGNPKVGFCLHFLMSPAAAGKDLVRGQRLTLARDAAGLPDAVRRVLADQPEFEAWVPSQLCVLYPEAIWVNKKRFDDGDGGAHLALAIWGVTSTGGQATFSIRTLASNSAALKRAMEAELVPMDWANLSVNPISESEDERYILKLEGGVLTLEGLARTDSIDVENVPFPSQAALRGLNNTLWAVAIDLKPTRLGTLPGALRVQGKRGLAEALLNSPIRFVDKVIAGGTGEVRFSH